MRNEDFVFLSYLEVLTIMTKAQRADCLALKDSLSSYRKAVQDSVDFEAFERKSLEPGDEFFIAGKYGSELLALLEQQASEQTEDKKAVSFALAAFVNHLRGAKGQLQFRIADFVTYRDKAVAYVEDKLTQQARSAFEAAEIEQLSERIVKNSAILEAVAEAVDGLVDDEFAAAWGVTFNAQ